MLSNKTVIKNILLILQVIISIFLVQIVLLGRFQVEELRYIWNIAKFIFAGGCIIVSINSFLNKHNNKVSFMAIGYLVAGTLLLMDIYIKYECSNDMSMCYEHFKCSTIINLVETIYIIIAIKYIKEETNIIKCGVGSLIVLILSTIVVFRIDLRETIRFSLETSSVCIQVVIMAYIAINLMLYLKKKYPIRKKRDIYISIILSIQLIYHILILWNGYHDIAAISQVIELFSLGNYIVVFSLIRYQTEQDVWKYEKFHLNRQKRRLKQDQEENKFLMFFANTLKTYVGEMSGAKALLEEKIKETKYADKLKYIEMIEKNCYRLLKLSNNVIDLNKMDIGDLSPQFKLTNMVHLIEVIIESITPYIETMGIEIELIKSQDILYSYIDRDAIERIMLNLISNAIKYNKDNGKISIYINRRGERVYLCVKDTGVGIPQNKLSTIFGRFERVDNKFVRSKEGSGLGLSIVKSLVDLHKGKVSIVSKDQEGTSVSISFPISRYENKEKLEGNMVIIENLKYNIEVEFSDIYM